jgi:hypothetical protein
MTISTIDPATPDPNAVAGLGDDEIRTLKTAIVNQFAGQVGDLYDIPVTAGPRALNAVSTKADQADLDALDARVSTLETTQGTQDAAIVAIDARLTSVESDYTTLAAALGAAWPVGAIYISADNVNPASKGLPGTWTAVGDGRFLFGGPAVGTTGGANSVQLTESNLPQHKHQHTTFREDSGNTAASTPSYAYTSPNQAFNSHKSGRDASSAEWAEFNTDEGVNLSASPDPINTQPAYLTVRFFQRTA